MSTSSFCSPKSGSQSSRPPQKLPAICCRKRCDSKDLPLGGASERRVYVYTYVDVYMCTDFISIHGDVRLPIRILIYLY